MNIVYKDSINVEDYNFLRESLGWRRLCNAGAGMDLWLS